jgi:hypothetical protein
MDFRGQRRDNQHMIAMEIAEKTGETQKDDDFNRPIFQRHGATQRRKETADSHFKQK